ncbi:MFS transporter [Desulfovibrio sp.]|uniref:MFS transporter n=1 Tax=Desulfovibrio sp. TaxID=885 RepID=UPI0025C020EA|nr:MFS transporter [Desulfovibrio sp.]
MSDTIHNSPTRNSEGQTPTSPGKPGPSRAARRRILLAVMVAWLPIATDMTILHIAVPSLTLALKATGTEILWIIDIYPLIMASLLVPMGTRGDSIGPRKLLLAGLVIFMAASLAAAFAPTARALIAARACLALGASMIVPSVLAIIRITFDDWKERAMALGIWGTVSTVSAAMGPLVGGLLLEHFWWGSVFLINVPLILIILPLAAAILPRPRPGPRKPWPIGQALTLAAGLMSTVYAVKTIFRQDSSLLLCGIALLGGIGLMALFIRKQMTARTPMLDLDLFRLPAIRVGLVAALVVSGALAGVELTIAQELQFVLGRTPLQAGIFMLPIMAASAVGGPLAGRLVVMAGLRNVFTVSLLAAGGSLAGLGLASFHDAGWLVAAYMVVLGLSLSIGLTASSIAIMGSVPPEKGGAAGSIEALGYDLGAGLGITAFGVLLAANYSTALRLPENLRQNLPRSALDSISDTMVAAELTGGEKGQAIVEAGQAAFSAAHSTVLLSAALLVCLLALWVFSSLRRYRGEEQGRG